MKTKQTKIIQVTVAEVDNIKRKGSLKIKPFTSTNVANSYYQEQVKQDHANRHTSIIPRSSRAEIIRQASEWEREATLQEHNIFVCYDTGTLTQEEYYMYCLFISEMLLCTIQPS